MPNAAAATVRATGADLVPLFTVGAGAAPTVDGDDLVFGDTVAQRVDAITPLDLTATSIAFRVATAQTARVRLQDAAGIGPSLFIDVQARTIAAEEYTAASTYAAKTTTPAGSLPTTPYMWLQFTHLPATGQIAYDYAPDAFGSPGRFSRLDTRAVIAGMDLTAQFWKVSGYRNVVGANARFTGINKAAPATQAAADPATLADIGRDSFNRGDTGANGGLGTAEVGGDWVYNTSTPTVYGAVPPQSAATDIRLRNDATTGGVGVAEFTCPANKSRIAWLRSMRPATNAEATGELRLVTNPDAQTASTWAGVILRGESISLLDKLHTRFVSRAPGIALTTATDRCGRRSYQVRDGVIDTTIADVHELGLRNDLSRAWEQNTWYSYQVQALNAANGKVRVRMRLWKSGTPKPTGANSWLFDQLVTPTGNTRGPGVCGLYAIGGVAATWQFKNVVFTGGLAADPTSADYCVSGAATDTTARFNIRTAQPETTVGADVSLDPTFATGVIAVPGVATTPGNNVAQLTATGLQPGKEYWYRPRIGGVSSPLVRGRFRTAPAPAGTPQSFRFWFSSCSDTNSVSPVFGKIRARDPLFGVHLGDFHYRNIAQAAIQPYYDGYNESLRGAQAELYAEVSTDLIYDDHDRATDDSDSTAVGGPSAAAALRECWPNHPLAVPDASGTGDRAWVQGRCLCIVSDGRHARTPKGAPDDATKTLFGADQKARLKALFRRAKTERLVILWFMPDPWVVSASGYDWQDTVGGYQTERTELQAEIESLGLSNSIAMLFGDNHTATMYVRVGVGRNAYGGFYAFSASPLDRNAVERGDPAAAGPFPPNGTANWWTQFGLGDLTDTGGDTLQLRLQAVRVDRLTEAESTLIDSDQVSPITLAIPTADVPAPAPTPVGVVIAPNAVAVQVGQETQPVAAILLSNNTTSAPRAGQVVYSTDVPAAVATVDPQTGRVRGGTRPGSGTLTATLTDGANPPRRAQVPLVVTAAVGGVSVPYLPDVTVTPRARSGAVITGRTVRWSSDNPKVASVDSQTGALVLHRTGTARIRAIVHRADGRTVSKSYKVVVTP